MSQQQHETPLVAGLSPASPGILGVSRPAVKRRKGLPRADGDRLREKVAYAGQRTFLQAVVRVRSPLLPVEEACVDELPEMVAHSRLLHAEDGLEVANADGFVTGPQQAVEDLEAMTIGERLEEALELGRLVRGQRGSRDRSAALDQRKVSHDN